MNLNKPIHSSKKNLNSVKAAVLLVQGQKPQAIQLMGGVTVLSNILLAAISLGSVTVGKAADRVGQALAKTIPMTISFLNSLLGPGGMPGCHPEDPQLSHLTVCTPRTQRA